MGVLRSRKTVHFQQTTTPAGNVRAKDICTGQSLDWRKSLPQPSRLYLCEEFLMQRNNATREGIAHPYATEIFGGAAPCMFEAWKVEGVLPVSRLGWCSVGRHGTTMNAAKQSSRLSTADSLCAACASSSVTASCIYPVGSGDNGAGLVAVRSGGHVGNACVISQPSVYDGSLPTNLSSGQLDRAPLHPNHLFGQN